MIDYTKYTDQQLVDRLQYLVRRPSISNCNQQIRRIQEELKKREASRGESQVIYRKGHGL